MAVDVVDRAQAGQARGDKARVGQGGDDLATKALVTEGQPGVVLVIERQEPERQEPEGRAPGHQEPEAQLAIEVGLTWRVEPMQVHAKGAVVGIQRKCWLD